MKYTGNLKLLKPEGHDKAGWQAFNNNSDILDKEIGNIKNKVYTAETNVTNSIKIKENITIAVAGWSKLGELYQYNIVDTDITADTVVDVNIHLVDLDKARDLKSANTSTAGKVTIYADDKPLSNIKCDLKIVKEAK